VGEFFIARVARIVPVYLFAFLICAPFALPVATLPSLLAEIAFVQAWGPPTFKFGPAWNGLAWTLSVEFFFYLTFPALLWAMSRMHVLSILAGTVVMLALMFFLQLANIFPGADDFVAEWLSYVPVPLRDCRSSWLGCCSGTSICSAPKEAVASMRPSQLSWR
jgi:peptidoglycan/LPS O-acetylase OafA/YrhL